MILNTARNALCSTTGFVTVLIFVLTLSACKQAEHTETATPDTEKFSIDPIWHSSHCWQKEEGAALLSSLDDVKTWWQSIHRTQLPRPSLADEFQNIDFSTHTIIVVNVGEKPTGGYGVELDRNRTVLQQGVLHLALLTKTPPKDSMQIQVITQACSVYLVDKTISKVDAEFFRGSLN